MDIKYAVEIQTYDGEYLPGYITVETQAEAEVIIKKVYAGTGWSTTPDTVSIYEASIEGGDIHLGRIVSSLSSNCYVDITKE